MARPRQRPLRHLRQPGAGPPHPFGQPGQRDLGRPHRHALGRHHVRRRQPRRSRQRRLQPLHQPGRPGCRQEQPQDARDRRRRRRPDLAGQLRRPAASGPRQRPRRNAAPRPAPARQPARQRGVGAAGRTRAPVGGRARAAWRGAPKPAARSPASRLAATPPPTMSRPDAGKRRRALDRHPRRPVHAGAGRPHAARLAPRSRRRCQPGRELRLRGAGRPRRRDLDRHRKWPGPLRPRAAKSSPTSGTTPRDPSSLRHNRIYYLHLSARGDVWVGTAGGLHRLERGAGGASVSACCR
jgi:hypothetical protein